MRVIAMLRVRPFLTSNSSNTTCCQVPSIISPPLTGIESEGPTREARTCDLPFPSPQRLSCA